MAGELRRLMPRDRWLLNLLDDHQVLTTEHIAALAFDNIHTARNRLSLLARRDILARFRDGVRPGSQQWRWTLGPAGAAYIAARNGTPEPSPATVRQTINRLAASPRLHHLLGINTFFVNLAVHAAGCQEGQLETWWSEQRCRTITGTLVRPDGHGVWTENGRTCSFWLEYDRSTEPAHKVVGKLDGYSALARATGITHTVLFILATTARETSLHPRFARHPAVADGTVIVATTTEPCREPAEAVWAMTGAPARVRLANIVSTAEY